MSVDGGGGREERKLHVRVAIVVTAICQDNWRTRHHMTRFPPSFDGGGITPESPSRGSLGLSIRDFDFCDGNGGSLLSASDKSSILQDW